MGANKSREEIHVNKKAYEQFEGQEQISDAENQ